MPVASSRSEFDFDASEGGLDGGMEHLDDEKQECHIVS